jgi:hypothetical protein
VREALYIRLPADTRKSIPIERLKNVTCHQNGNEEQIGLNSYQISKMFPDNRDLKPRLISGNISRQPRS